MEKQLMTELELNLECYKEYINKEVNIKNMTAEEKIEFLETLLVFEKYIYRIS